MDDKRIWKNVEGQDKGATTEMGMWRRAPARTQQGVGRKIIGNIPPAVMAGPVPTIHVLHLLATIGGFTADNPGRIDPYNRII
jgi:hypothetical protein